MNVHPNRAKNILRIVISLFFLFLAGYLLRDKWSGAIELLRTMDMQFFLYALSFFVALNLIAAFRFSQALQMQDIHISYGYAIYVNFIGLFFNLFLPSSLGGDVIKAYYVVKKSGKKMKTITSILMDRVFGLAAVLTIVLIALPFFMKSHQDPKVVYSVSIFTAAFIFAVLLLLSKSFSDRFKFLMHLIPTKRFKEKVANFLMVISQFRQHKAKILFCYILSIFIQIIFIIAGFMISKSLGLSVSFVVFMLVLPVSGIISMLPSLGGLGVREISVVYFLSKYTSSEHAIAYALASDILVYGFGMFCGILYLFFGGKVKIKEMELYDR